MVVGIFRYVVERLVVLCRGFFVEKFFELIFFMRKMRIGYVGGCWK